MPGFIPLSVLGSGLWIHGIHVMDWPPPSPDFNPIEPIGFLFPKKLLELSPIYLGGRSNFLPSVRWLLGRLSLRRLWTAFFSPCLEEFRLSMNQRDAMDLIDHVFHFLLDQFNGGRHNPLETRSVPAAISAVRILMKGVPSSAIVLQRRARGRFRFHCRTSTTNLPEIRKRTHLRLITPKHRRQ